MTVHPGQTPRPQLMCPAGTPAALRTAVEAGADAVYCGLQNATNARNFPGLNFTADELIDAVRFAHDRAAKVLLAVNTFPPAGRFGLWADAVDVARAAGVDAVIVADIGVADYVARTYPDLRMHLSVQAGAGSAEAIRFFCEEFGIRRAILPRLLTLREIEGIAALTPCELEVFVFGNIGMMSEGRCSLSNYVTGVSTNMDGVCSPPADVRYERDSAQRTTIGLGPFAIDRFGPDEIAGYPTICKGRYLCRARNEAYYAFEEPVSLNLLMLIPDLMRAGIAAFKIEGRQRSRAYVRTVVSAFRKAVDDVAAGRDPTPGNLLNLAEGHKETEAAVRSKGWR